MSTRLELLTFAESMLRTKGYSAFSYADLATAIGIKKASIHHHFPTKEILGITIVENNIAQLIQQFEEIDSNQKSAMLRLEKYTQIFLKGSKNNLLPLCGALAAESSVLPDSLKVLTKRFFEVQLSWIQKTILMGQEQNMFQAELDANKIARTLLSFLEGQSFVAWALNDAQTSHFDIEFFMNGIKIK